MDPGERKTGTDWSGSSVRLVMSSWLGVQGRVGVEVRPRARATARARARARAWARVRARVRVRVSGQWSVVSGQGAGSPRARTRACLAG